MKSMTIEERIADIKNCAKCALYTMENHKRSWCHSDSDNENLNNVINRMHNAKNKYQLAEAYTAYINACIALGYADGEIIAGIMQNESKNKEFDVNIDSVIKQFINFKYGKTEIDKHNVVENQQNDSKNTEFPTASSFTKKLAMFKSKIENDILRSTTEQKNDSVNLVIDLNNKNEDNTTTDIKNNKIISKIENKIKYADSLLSNLLNNQCENPAANIDKIKSICEEAKQKISSIDYSACNEEEIAKLNDFSKTTDVLLKSMEALTNANTVTENQNTNTKTQQAAAAHTEGGFSINSFIKPQPNNNNVVVSPTEIIAKNSDHRPTVFPHQICGLTDEELVADVSKHFKVIDAIPAYALYDLYKNKKLSNKMKELGAAQRVNNPYLTQVNINEYIDVPELLSKYSLCFTIPCSDKDKVIIVLFNPNPVQDKNCIWNYPLHIFKAARTKKK